MRKLYSAFFRIPKQGKICEKVILTRLAATITVMVVCLIAMSISAYAYFSCNVTSGSNYIKTASFETSISVQITDSAGNPVDDSQITPQTSNHKSFRVEGLEVGKWYYVTIQPTNRSTAQTGFMIVSAEGCNTTYHTQQLGVDKNVPGGKTEKITFKLMLTDATDVVFKAHWGTSSFYSAYQITSINDERYITLDEEIKMVVNGYNEPNITITQKEESEANPQTPSDEEIPAPEDTQTDNITDSTEVTTESTLEETETTEDIEETSVPDDEVRE